MAHTYQGQHPRQSYPPPPQAHMHHPDAVFVNGWPQQTPIQNVTIRALTAVLGAVFLVGASATAAYQFSEIKYAIKDLSKDVKVLSAQLNERIDRVEKDNVARASDLWTKTQHDLWCERAQRVNVKNGWKCPPQIHTTGLNFTTGSWKPTPKD